MDWYASFRRIKQAFPLIAMAGVASITFGCAHTQHGNGPHADSVSHQNGDVVADSSSNTIQGLDELAEKMGIRLVSLRTTADGHMLDLRYRVVDKDKAHQVLKVASKIDVFIIDTESGTIAKIPKTMLGKLRGKSPNARTDQVYYFILGNPHQMIRSGSTVKIVVGDITVTGFPVM